MTIIRTKDGVDPSKQEYTGTCNRCKSEYSALHEDLIINMSRNEESTHMKNCDFCGGGPVYFHEVVS